MNIQSNSNFKSEKSKNNKTEIPSKNTHKWHWTSNTTTNNNNKCVNERSIIRCIVAEISLTSAKLFIQECSGKLNMNCECDLEPQWQLSSRCQKWFYIPTLFLTTDSKMYKYFPIFFLFLYFFGWKVHK